MTNVFFNDQNTIAFDQAGIAHLKEVAQAHPQKCARFCLHHDNQAGVQEMLLVMHRDSRFAPHRHPNYKSESIHIVEGKIGMSVFDQSGQVTQLNVLAPNAQFLFRLEGGTWHLPIALSEWVVFHEVFHGPYSKEDDVESLRHYQSEAAINSLYNQLISQFKEMESNE
ncbi:WbuC family cupin fold metalloprotein [Pseudoalteromonas luteoviolacea]|uniref:WbuC family cupin fold metalloprotein n=1 Tax=Pseudoalteromonas luteoviolacea TaxID=43657 RepID=UPI001B36CD05|nr:WbuC family cupin fold metalloprotein [Pseudoalteromonas luteoviolacea]MBQ4836988.1 WbuC family cupin fold metalloprotein [Pseudoalteromonas luteoviolacea]